MIEMEEGASAWGEGGSIPELPSSIAQHTDRERVMAVKSNLRSRRQCPVSGSLTAATVGGHLKC